MLALWSSQALSVFGDRLYAMAIMWIAWKQSGAGAMGLVAIAESVPYIVMGTLGRKIMDRFASLRALGAVDAVRVFLVAALPVVWDNVGTLGMLALATALGLASAVFDLNLGALVPDLVRPDEVQAVNGLMDLTGRIARVAGPGAAGALLVFVPQAALFLLDAATFAVSAVALAALGQATQGGTGPVPPADAVALRARSLLRAHPATAAAITVHGAGIFAQAVSMAMPALLASQLHAGAGAYGLVLAATGAGALVGNLVVGNTRLPRQLPVAYCALWAVSGLFLAVTGAAGNLPVLLAVSAASGAVSPFLGVTLQTHLASFPPAARRRLMSLDLTVIRAAGTTSMLVIPVVAAAQPVAGFWVGGLATVTVSLTGAAMAWWWPRDTATLPVTETAPQLSRD
ncbi:MFS transporter [Streptomyces sp. NPDC001848]|uniref:MFS transporter n=1 Tax=Streptomyces sp. NPDC001848 TaxID=3364618 RepID=UPI003682DC74